MAVGRGKGPRMGLESLKARILRSIKPTDEEIRFATYRANEIIARLKAATPRNVEIVTAGSVARGTQVRGSYDIDIFLLFPRSQDERRMEAEGLAIAKKIVNKRRGESFAIKYAEHPYVKVSFGDDKISADIVPAFKIKDATEIGSAVDRTPLHNEFVNKNLNGRQKDDVRILKAFLKNHEVYGAEAKVRGFSGYLCELLIFNYGSFEGVINAFSKMRLPLIVNVGNKLCIDPKSAEGVALEKQFKSDFVFLDPTDINRNVAASVSQRSIAKLALLSKSMLKKADMKTFSGPKYSTTMSRDRILALQKAMNIDIYLLAFKSDDIADDIVWEQLVKFRNRLGDLLAKNGFSPLQSFQNAGNGTCIIAFLINKSETGSVLLRGPSVFMGDAVNAFSGAHKASFALFLENDRVVSLDKPRYSNAHELLSGLKRNNNVTIPSHLKPASSFLFVNSEIPESYAKLLYEAFESARIRYL